MKYLVYFTFLFYAFSLSAEIIHISSVEVDCSGDRCRRLRANFQKIKGESLSKEELGETLDGLALYSGLSSFSYEIKNRNTLYVKIKTEKIIDDISFRVGPEFKGSLPQTLPLLFGDYYNDSQKNKMINFLTEYFSSLGYLNHSIKIIEKKNRHPSYVDLVIQVDFSKPVYLDKLVINTESPFIKEIFLKHTQSFIGKIFDFQKIKSAVDNFETLIKDYGYYGSSLSHTVSYVGEKATLDFVLKPGAQIAFDVPKNEFFTKIEVKNELKILASLYKDDLEAESVKKKLESVLERFGVFLPLVSVKKINTKNIWGLPLHIYKIRFKNLKRTRFKGVHFRGNYALNNEVLGQIFSENATEQIENGYFDQSYFDSFKNLLVKKYIESGYVSSKIDDPKIFFDERKNEINVDYKIVENVKATVSSIKISGVDSLSLENKIRSLLELSEGEVFNPGTFQTKIKVIENFLQDSGYYYSSITNLTSDDFVKYSNDATKVSIHFKIETGKIIYINKVFIMGLVKTKDKLIKREIDLKEGDILTPALLKNAQINLLSLALFSSINLDIKKIKEERANIYLYLKEREPGSLEIAPGFRTDLGFKLSSTLSYNNLEGMNKIISFKGQVNRRINHESFDERRRKEKKTFMEYEGIVNYSENHVLNSNIDFSTSLSRSQKRYFAFDADISRINATISKNITDKLATSLKYQLEVISQFDATNENEEGEFRIGSFTPGLSYDLRNNRINPTSGAMFSLSSEFANPTFLSQNTKSLEINYYKVISRNRFYYPLSQGTIALSLSAGMEENLARSRKSNGALSGYIPNIKVFRLSGIDTVRGFEDGEINRLPSGQDISELIIEDKAYMVNLKLEPRYFLNDNIMLGVFYDAGRVFVDEKDINDLRSSVGLSFKFLTPVGSLDFDYGIKLLRKKDKDGNLESPGRLHVSIGFF